MPAHMPAEAVRKSPLGRSRTPVSFRERDVRLYDSAAIVRNVQRNRGEHDGREIAIAVRVTQVRVLLADRWRLASIQFSPLAEN